MNCLSRTIKMLNTRMTTR